MTSKAQLRDQSKKTVTTFFFLAGLALVATLAAGLLAAIYYTSHFETLARLNLSFQSLRPLHVGGASTWIYLAGIGVVMHFLFEHAQERAEKGLSHLDAHGFRRHVGVMLSLWVPAALIAFVTLLSGVFSGREYLGFHPGISLLVILGWLVFARLFFKVYGFSLKRAPVHVWMWVTGIFLFMYAFTEAHAYLLQAVSRQPIRDLAVQWKSYGTLVGSFNLLVYGALIYLGSRADNGAYAHSKTAFALFFLGILNSFTNYGHHTYHLPQSALIKWIAFVVSMTEILVLAKVAYDLVKIKALWQMHAKQRPLVAWILTALTAWTFLQLALALLISVPPINTFMHGTHMILAHSMGSMIGIDTMALLAMSAFLYRVHHGEEAAARNYPVGRWALLLLNLGLLLLWTSLGFVGLQSAARLYWDGVPAQVSHFPTWMGAVMMVSGLSMTIALALMIHPWFRRAQVVLSQPLHALKTEDRTA